MECTQSGRCSDGVFPHHGTRPKQPFHTQGAAYLNLWAPHPADGRQLVLQEQVIRLIIEAPLADGEVGACVFDLGRKWP